MQMRSRPGRLEPGPRFVLLNKIMQDGVVLTDASTRQSGERTEYGLMCVHTIIY